MKYEIRVYGDSVLRRKAEAVRKIDDDIRQLAGDMIETMYANNGLGLAAEQVGRQEAICVIHVPPGSDQDRERNESIPMPLVLVNPSIVEEIGRETLQEGCLSFPELFVQVERAGEVVVSFTDLENERQMLRATGMLARAIQHELDHLNGVLLVDRMSAVQKVAVSGRLKRIKKAGAAKAAAL